MSNSCGNMIPTMCGGSMIPTFVTNEIGVACETILNCEDALGDDMLPYMNCVDTELHTTC